MSNRECRACAIGLRCDFHDGKGVTFRAWPKIARLNRDIVITEKVDGTNAAVGITAACCDEQDPIKHLHPYAPAEVYAQSRTRIITPTKDNFGFAKWVADNAVALREVLGVGLHFGEWWGQGIQRGYGLTERRFSLFNTARWGYWDAPGPLTEGFERDERNLYPVDIYAVPVLYSGPFSQLAIDRALDLLRTRGSTAAPGFAPAEGIVVFHAASSTMFKVTLEGDEKPKGQAA